MRQGTPLLFEPGHRLLAQRGVLQVYHYAVEEAGGVSGTVYRIERGGLGAGVHQLAQRRVHLDADLLQAFG